MKLFYLALWQFMVILVIGEHHAFSNISSKQTANKTRYKREITIETLTLKVKINGKVKIINLVSTNQLLANEYLPVWALPPHPDIENFRDLDIMKENVGDFTMYHDYVTRSALVYFHKRRELDGIVDMMYKVEGISIDKLDEEYIIDPGCHRFRDIWKYAENLGFSRKKSGTEFDVKCEKFRPKIYPELLIAISYDMLVDIESTSESPLLIKTISHVIIVYNAVDMLFKFVKSADISVNIAGIVFESDKNAWGFLAGTSGKSHIDANEINKQVRTYFRGKGNVFRRHSFDYIAYHTTKKLIDKKWFSLHGIADQGDFEPAFKSQKNSPRLNMAIRDSKSYGHYSTIAHELTHLFGADHDGSINWHLQNPSCRSVMATCGTPNLCLKWSDKTEEDLKRFVSSPAHCILKNKPNSLLPENPRLIFTIRQQCRCYGYQSTHEENESDVDICSKRIQCLDKVGKVSTDLPFPMDGTPCGGDINKVCWRTLCVTIGQN